MIRYLKINLLIFLFASLLKTQDKDVLIVNDNSSGASAYLIERALSEIGRLVDVVEFSTHDPLTYDQYKVVLWSAGNKSSQIFNNAPKRAALIQRALSEKKVWVEGGNVGLVFGVSPDTLFKKHVLHLDSWINDALNASIIPVISHPVFSEPNAITTPIIFSGNNSNDKDIARNIPNDEGRKRIALWTSGSSDSLSFSINSWSSSPNQQTSHTFFTAFNFAAISDSNVAKAFIQNIGTFLLVPDNIPQIVIYSPKDLEMIQAGTEQLIRWGKNRISFVKLEYRLLNELDWSLIADSIPAYKFDENGNIEVDENGLVMGSYLWFVPDVDTPAYIRISESGNPAVSTENQSPFFISFNSPPNWSSRTTMPIGQNQPMSVYFPIGDSGYVYVFGGKNPNGDSVNQRYNIVSGKWTQKSPLPFKSTSGGAVAVGNKIYVIGGHNSVNKILNKVQIYNPLNDTWTQGATIPQPEKADFGIGVYNNLIYTVGGDSGVNAGGVPTNKVRVYNTNNNTWNEATPFPYSVAKCAVGIERNIILVVGGTNRSTFISYDSVYRGIINTSNPLEIEWANIGFYPLGAMVRSSVAKIHSGLIFVGGDSNFSSNNRSSALICLLNDYTNEVDRWFSFPNMSVKRSNMGPTLASNGFDSVWAIGGYANGVSYGTNEALYIPQLPVYLGVPSFENNIPSVFSLSQNYPNPFNPITTIHFSIRERSFVSLKIYSITGEEIATLVDGEVEVGDYSKQFDANLFSSGVYFYRLSVISKNGKPFSETKKMLLMK